MRQARVPRPQVSLKRHTANHDTANECRLGMRAVLKPGDMRRGHYCSPFSVQRENPPIGVLTELVRAVALAAGAAGCVVQQKMRGVFPAEHLPPPPSETALKGAPGQTEAQAGAPERKPLSVPR